MQPEGRRAVNKSMNKFIMHPMVMSSMEKGKAPKWTVSGGLWFKFIYSGRTP